MAKETVQAIRQAEQQAKELSMNTKEQIEQLLLDTKAKGQARLQTCDNTLQEEEALALDRIQTEIATIQSDTKQKTTIALQALESQAATKQADAIKAVIDALVG